MPPGDNNRRGRSNSTPPSTRGRERRRSRRRAHSAPARPVDGVRALEDRGRGRIETGEQRTRNQTIERGAVERTEIGERDHLQGTEDRARNQMMERGAFEQTEIRGRNDLQGEERRARNQIDRRRIVQGEEIARREEEGEASRVRNQISRDRIVQGEEIRRREEEGEERRARNPIHQERVLQGEEITRREAEAEEVQDMDRIQRQRDFEDEELVRRGELAEEETGTRNEISHDRIVRGEEITRREEENEEARARNEISHDRIVRGEEITRREEENEEARTRNQINRDRIERGEEITRREAEEEEAQDMNRIRRQRAFEDEELARRGDIEDEEAQDMNRIRRQRAFEDEELARRGDIEDEEAQDMDQIRHQRTLEDVERTRRGDLAGENELVRRHVRLQRFVEGNRITRGGDLTEEEERDGIRILEKAMSLDQHLPARLSLSDADVQEVLREVRRIKAEGVDWNGASQLFGEDSDFQEIFENRMKRTVDAPEKEGRGKRLWGRLKGAITGKKVATAAVSLVPVAGGVVGVTRGIIKRSNEKAKKRVARVLSSMGSNNAVRKLAGPLFASHEVEESAATISATVGAVSAAASGAGSLAHAPLTASAEVGKLIAHSAARAGHAVGTGLAGQATQIGVTQGAKFGELMAEGAAKKAIADQAAQKANHEEKSRIDYNRPETGTAGVERTQAFLEFLGMKSRLSSIEEHGDELTSKLRKEDIKKELVRLEIRHALGMTNDNEDLLDRTTRSIDRKSITSALQHQRVSKLGQDLQDKLVKMSKKAEYLNEQELEAYNKLKKITKFELLEGDAKRVAEIEEEINSLMTQAKTVGRRGGYIGDVGVKIKKLEDDIQVIMRAAGDRELRARTTTDIEADLKDVNLLALLFKTEGLFNSGPNRQRRTKGFRRLLDPKEKAQAELDQFERTNPIGKAIAEREAELSSLYQDVVHTSGMGGVTAPNLPATNQQRAREIRTEINELRAQMERVAPHKKVEREQLTQELKAKKGQKKARKKELEAAIEAKKTQISLLYRSTGYSGARGGALVRRLPNSNLAEFNRLEGELEALEEEKKKYEERFAFPKRR